MSQIKNYEIRYDLLNIVACISVVILHVNGSIWTFSTETHWKVSLFLETVFYWAVPVFFMLSGATLIDYRKRYSTKIYLKKRLIKTVLPYLFWSMVSIPWALYESGYLTTDTVLNIREILNIVLNSKAMSVYWFFSALFSVYLIIPVLGCIPEEKRKRIFLYLILYSFIADSICPLLGPLFGIYVNGLYQNPFNGGGYIVFVLIGYYISKYPISKNARISIYICGVFGWAIRFFYTLYSSITLHNIDKTMFNYSYFPSVLLAVAVFTFFWYTNWSFVKEKHVELIRRIAGDSFGVYLIHFYILRYLVDHLQIPMESYSWKLWGTIVVYFLSLVITDICKRSYLLRYFFP